MVKSTAKLDEERTGIGHTTQPPARYNNIVCATRRHFPVLSHTQPYSTYCAPRLV